MTDLFDPPFEDEDDQPEQSPGSRRLADGRRLAADDGGLPTARRILTVTELTVRVRDLLEREFFEVWVEGELSNCRVWHTGHLYFTLKDGSSQIRSVIFRSALRYLKFKPADGLRVVARGRVSVYEPKGEYQLVCEHLEPHGLGALQIARVPGVDVVIVGRGGGSIEDLWAFNEEVVARAIARVPVPVISAVGHETDVTIADF